MYILNHTNTTLSVGQFADIPPGKYIKGDKFILESAEVAYAVRAKWASLHEAPPAEIPYENEKVNFEVPAVVGTSKFPEAEPAAVPAEEVKEVEPEVKEAEPEVSTAKKGGRKPAASTQEAE